ncbi:glycine betaine ABC transporter substrate-binding protein [Microbacterium hydrocarbonoxydans]|uniref:Glycine betaine/proline transport system substrate-binding protein n=1 Tax=Microbacterium hydrocarbonoxydans TaxID=273678 RepID=A0A1H4IR78_9MICO|nr:glycine betaine ABC transporter substrate-binding protein [Microbacterium hydrocarbonoxydans]SEB36604.1 glycine betaine/proline transport system substrate-binding protein [Microbacterium hydrocarbonoxydans]
MKKKLLTIAAIGAAATLTLAGCSGDGMGGTGGGDAGSDSGSGDKGTITLGFLPSWTDGLSTAYLLQDQLEKIGYTVEMKTLTEAGPLYTGLAQGDVDIYPSAWPELTHKSYMDQYGDDIEDLGAYYDNAKLTLAVPEYSDLTSIEDLAGKGAEFDGKIFGIEPGAGLTAQTQKMMPEYGLDSEYELVTSSTAAMLTELKSATDKEEDIVVTLWRPFWANDAFPLKDLEDPKGAMGEAERLHFLGTKGFAEEFPEAAELIEQIKLDDEQYGSLEDLVVNEYGEGKEADAVDAWLEEHGDDFDWVVS